MMVSKNPNSLQADNEDSDQPTRADLSSMGAQAIV